jgi:hypothetical protein
MSQNKDTSEQLPNTGEATLPNLEGLSDEEKRKVAIENLTAYTNSIVDMRTQIVLGSVVEGVAFRFQQLEAEIADRIKKAKDAGKKPKRQTQFENGYLAALKEISAGLAGLVQTAEDSRIIEEIDSKLTEDFDVFTELDKENN